MKYKVEKDSDTRLWWERNREELEVSGDELSALCEECEFSKVNGNTIDRSGCFKEHCMDCPVQKMIESINELAAEAAMS